MRYFFAILMALHGLISLMGFLKAFQLVEIKQFEFEISRVSGSFWLLSSLLLFVASVQIINRSEIFWIVGGLAFLVSQIMIVSYWKDAKFGTILNVVLLVLVVINFSMWNHHRNGIQKGEVLVNMKKTGSVVVNEDLPELIKKWMSYVGTEDEDFSSAVQFSQNGQLRLAPDKGWINFSADQFVTLERPSFLWAARVGSGEIMQFSGVDQYMKGKGNMNIALYGMIDVVNASGKQIDEGTAIRFLGEIVWYPWMAKSKYLEWEIVNDRTLMATFNYKDIEVQGTFEFNENNVPVLFKALRYNEEMKKKVPWRVDIDGESYTNFGGIKIPADASVTWEYEKGDFQWLKVEIIDYSYELIK